MRQRGDPQHQRGSSPLRVVVVVICVVVATLVYLGWCASMPGQSPQWTKAAEDEQRAQRLRKTVEVLASETVPRSDINPVKYEAAARYLEQQLNSFGYQVNRQEIQGMQRPTDNLAVELPGERHDWVVVGAHFDAAYATPGADDNASGTAVLLELAKSLRGKSFERSLRLIFFANEEPPHFQQESMGSLVAAKLAKGRGDRIAIMLSLEMLGYFDDSAGSQKYPMPLGLFFPTKANFLAVVGRTGDRKWLTCAVEVARDARAVPFEGFAGPSFFPGLDYSDQWSYWQQGYPALMVTDTAFFRNKHYHRKSDTPDTLDYPRMAAGTRALEQVVTTFANAKGCGS